MSPTHTLQTTQQQLEREKTTGKNWFDMPAIEVTPELKNDLRVLKMRSALDPAQHYKANDSKALPKYFQVRIHNYVYGMTECMITIEKVFRHFRKYRRRKKKIFFSI